MARPHGARRSVAIWLLACAALVYGILVVGGALIARRNLRLGRSDRRGAMRLAVFVFACSMISWAFGASHVASDSEFALLLVGASLALFFAGVCWLLYVALEPLIRRRWPDSLIAWTRLLSGRLSETDPQQLGVPPLPVCALAPEAEKTAALVNAFVEAARPLLRDAAPANMLLLRGFDQRPHLPLFPETFRLRAAAIAAYPMYRGLSRLVGMDVLKTGGTFAEEIDTLEEQWEHYDFFFLHYKDTDKAGEDGDFAAKVAALERFDALLPRVLALRPDVLAISGDHATPSILKGHGWQGVPALVASAYCGDDLVSRFTERDCASGSLGVMPAQDLMPLLMANALRFTKYGA